jgi:hypothetical protein
VASKNAMVLQYFHEFCIFCKLFCKLTKKGQKNGQQTENCSKKLVCHFTEKLYERLFLGIGYSIEKKYRFWPNPNFVK